MSRSLPSLALVLLTGALLAATASPVLAGPPEPSHAGPARARLKARPARPGPARSTDTTTQAEQQAMTPDAALEALRAGNERFRTGKTIVRDYHAQAELTAHAQYPFATVLACMDSRSTPELIFDTNIGDVFAPRVAGNLATDEEIGSMEYAAKVAGSKLIVVLGHSSCGAVKGACDQVELGNLTTVLRAIQPSVAAVTTVPGPRTSKNDAFVHAVTEENVRRQVAQIRARSPILAAMEKAGQIKIVGALHDLASGTVTFLE